MSRWDSISITAHYTAQVWVQQHFPQAEHFDTAKGRALYRLGAPFGTIARSIGYPALEEILVARHRMIDRRLEQLQPAQVIELAAGLSPRCLAYALKHTVPCIDADLPRMIAVKRARVGRLAPAHYRLAEIDLIEAPDYAAALASVIALRAPTVVITEGLLPYFSVPDQQAIFRKIARLLRACGGGVYLTDIYHHEEEARLGVGAGLFRSFLHRFARTPRPTQLANLAAGRTALLEQGFVAFEGHQPVEASARDAGLCMYEATIENSN